MLEFFCPYVACTARRYSRQYIYTTVLELSGIGPAFNRGQGPATEPNRQCVIDREMLHAVPD